MNLIKIAFNCTAIIGFILGVNELGNNPDKADDDTIAQLLESGNFYWVAGCVEVICFISIILHSFGVYGALKRKMWAIKVAVVAYAIPVPLSFYGFNLLN